LPIEVKCGKIGKLKINISWKNIMTKPAMAEIEDLFVLLGPFEENINDPTRIEEISKAHKRKLLAEYEKIDKAEIYESKEKGFAEKVQDTIINNIQIYIRNVHIRYEDKFSIKNKVISFGLYLSEFRAETVDASGKPNFLNADEKIIFKLGSLTGFNLYWNSIDLVDTLISVRPEINNKDKEFVWVDTINQNLLFFNFFQYIINK
jgi:vacuolar protein sorting-associated protein 13A/C